MEENTATLDIRAINEKIESESAFIDLGYETRLAEFQHFSNLDLRDNSFLLAFPAAQNPSRS